MDARSGAALDGTDLLEKQMVMFEECLIEDEDGAAKCQELDQALTAMERQLKEDNVGAMDSFAHLFGKSKLDRAAARLRKAASYFGTEQEAIAKLWIDELRGDGSKNPFDLLEQQVALFGECLVDEDGSGPQKCKELSDALAALQSSLGVRGKIVSTAGLMRK